MAFLGLRFEQVPVNLKTSVWYVLSDQVALGQIRWWAPWRRYTFQPNPSTIYDATCLKQIMEFIESEMRKRKDSR